MFSTLTTFERSSSSMNNHVQNHARSDEEELVRLLGFAPLEKIVKFTSGKDDLDLHCPTEKLKTPLTAAVNRGDVGILKTLVEKYSVIIDSTTTQPCGKTALMHASYVTRNADILGLLIARGADLHKTDVRGWNCLYYAVVGERIGNVKYLLESGAKVNSQDEQGRSPLMIAVVLSNLAIAKVLLDYGADAETRDNLGYGPLRLSILRKKEEQAVLLAKSGSVSSVPSTSTYSDYELAEYLMPDLNLVAARRGTP